MHYWIIIIFIKKKGVELFNKNHIYQYKTYPYVEVVVVNYFIVIGERIINYKKIVI